MSIMRTRTASIRRAGRRAGCAALVVAVVMACGLPTAGAQGVPGTDRNKCLAGKTKCVNKKVAGLLKCREKCQKSPEKCGTVQDDCETKVRNKFDGGGVKLGCFEKLEAKDDGVTPNRICTTTGDQADMDAKADATVANVVATLEGSVPFSLCGNDVIEGVESCDGGDLGGTSCESLGFAAGTLGCSASCGYDVSECVPNPPITCGNGTIDGGEDCDLGNLNGKTCVTEGFIAGELACGAGCVFDTSGCFAVRFADTGVTILDHLTGLEWEKKVAGSGCLHCVNDTYDWTTDFGSMFDWVSEVNGWSADGTTQVGLGGRSDWRIPNSAELQTILQEPFPCSTIPCIDPIFGPTQTCNYWSSTISNDPDYAWIVDFDDGYVSTGSLDSPDCVRAVRGGS